MKILFLSQVPLIKYGLKWGFDQLGWETQYLDKECHAIWEKSHEQQFILLKNRIENFKPDLVFTEGYGGLPLIEVYNFTKQKGIPLFTWDIEADCTPQIGEFFIKYCDALFTTMEEKIPDFNNRYPNIRVNKLLFGCNPDFHKSMPSETRFKHDISLVCRNYSNRYAETNWFVMPLLKKKYDVKIYGCYWMDLNRPVNLKDYKNNYWSEASDLPYEWLPIVINSSKIMLGMNVPVVSQSHSSMRCFETLSSAYNSLFVAHYQEGQYNLFKDYIYHVKNEEETELAIKEILSMTDEQRQEKAKLASEFTIKNHNYKLRAESIINVYKEL
jgi:spore maturation protein CgeB